MKYTGGCHCGAVRYEVEADLAKVIECNCSHCHKKGLLLDFVDKDKFKLLSGEENLVDYRFNKKSIRHLFCKTCGVESFAEGVSFPKMAINVRCLDGVEPKDLKIEPYNGRDI
jgi:hypothetical protein